MSLWELRKCAIGGAWLVVASAACSVGGDAGGEAAEPTETASSALLLDPSQLIPTVRLQIPPAWAACYDENLRFSLASRFVAARPPMLRVPLSLNGVRLGSVNIPLVGQAHCSPVPGRGGEWVAKPFAPGSHFCSHTWRPTNGSLPDYDALEAAALAAIGRPGGWADERDPIFPDCRATGSAGTGAPQTVSRTNTRIRTERSDAGRSAIERCLVRAKSASTLGAHAIARDACLSSLSPTERASFDACLSMGHDVAWCLRPHLPFPRVPQCGSCGVVDPETREILVTNPAPAVADATLELHLPQSESHERVIVTVEHVNAPTFTIKLPASTLAKVGNGFFAVK